MKTLKESLFNKENLENSSYNVNKYNLTYLDMKGNLEGFPVGVVIRMMEEQEKQGNEPNVTVFQKDSTSGADENGGGFTWNNSIEGFNFWDDVIGAWDFETFFKRYPEYEKYN